MKRDYEYQYAELRARLYDQYQQQLHNQTAASLSLDNSIGEQVREQVRLAQQLERDEDERRQSLLQQSTDSDELKRLVNKLHSEGNEKEKQQNWNQSFTRQFDTLENVVFITEVFERKTECDTEAFQSFRRNMKLIIVDEFSWYSHPQCQNSDRLI